MKSLFSLLLLLFATTGLKAQTISRSIVSRKVQFRTIGKDSIDLNLNEDYDLIEDSCSLIVRHGHINIRDRKFFWRF